MNQGSQLRIKGLGTVDVLDGVATVLASGGDEARAVVVTLDAAPDLNEAKKARCPGPGALPPLTRSQSKVPNPTRPAAVKKVVKMCKEFSFLNQTL